MVVPQVINPKGPLPKIGRSRFILILLYSGDEFSHHTKFYQNRLKNMEVTTMFSPPQFHDEFVRKYEFPKFDRIQFFTLDDIGFSRR